MMKDERICDILRKVGENLEDNEIDVALNALNDSATTGIAVDVTVAGYIILNALDEISKWNYYNEQWNATTCAWFDVKQIEGFHMTKEEQKQRIPTGHHGVKELLLILRMRSL